MARKDLPSPNAPNFLLRVREEVHALLGKLGNGADRALTLRDAIESGVIVPGPGGSLIPGPGAGAAEEPDLTPPPQPGAFTATGAISHFLLSQAQPAYTQGNGHSRTVVYGAQWTSGPLPVFANAVELDRFAGTVRAVASNPATTWRLWIKWESNDGVLSATPAGGTNGVEVTTGQDVALLLEAMSGQISSSELAASLATPIGQIPSISATASDALTKANQSLASIATMQTELANLSGTPDYDAGTTYALDDIVKYSGGLYRALGTTTGNLPTNTTYWQKIGDYASLGDAVSAHAAQLSDHEARITANEGELTAQASDITQLQADISTTNAAVATKASASALTALDTRVTAVEGVNTSQGYAITNLQNSVTTLNDGLATKADATALTALTTRVTAAEGVNTSQATAITGLQSSVTTLSNGLATKADASALTTTNTNVSNLAGTVSAQAGQITTLQANVDARVLGLPLDQWNDLKGHPIVTLTDGKVGNKALRISGTGQYPNQGVYVPIDRTKTYRTRFWARPSASNASGLLYFSLYQFTDTGAGPINGGRAPYKPSAVSPADHNANFGAQQWGLYSFTWGPDDWQAGVTRVLPEFLDNYPGAPGYWEIQGFEFTDVTATEALSASLQVESTTRATQTGELYAQYTVKTDVGGLVSGYGLASTASNAAPTSAFGVQAGQFFVAPPAVAAATAPTAGLFKGYAWRDTTANVTKYWTGDDWSTSPQSLPFVVQAVPTTINGVEVPPGVYMDSAYMRTFVAQAGQIGELAVDDAAIASVSASKITAGSIAVGQYIQSTGIYPGDGTPNFRVDGNGLAILNQAVVRGIVYASGGEFTGTVRGATIIGGTLTTAESGQRVKIDEQGILFLTGAANGKYGGFKYGSKKYGDGVLVYFNNTIKRVPFYVASEQNVADIHLYNRSADPPPGESGDLICVNSRIKTWDAFTARWRSLAFSD